MTENQVLARKYRPRNFQELIGQEAVSRTLSLALDSGKLSHAYLFSGLRGSGKTSTARIFAKALLCDRGIGANPCGECEQCVQALEGRHMDIVEMDAASNRRIDDIRDLIEQTRYAPTFGRFKVFIIDEVHMLTKEAFNALLKTLEEPPAYVKFLLATTDPLKLPPTILSRTQHFRFKKIAFNDVLNHLLHVLSQERVEADPQALEMISRAGGGSLRDTLTLLDQAIIFGKGRVDLAATVEMLGVLDPAQIERYFDLIFQRDVAQAVAFVREIEGSDAEMVIDELIGYLKEKLFKPQPPFSVLVLERFFRICGELKSLLFQGADSGFVLGLLTLKLIEALRPEAVDEAIERLEREILQAPAPHAVPVRTAAHAAAAPAPAAPRTPEGLFARLQQRIDARSPALGEVFARSVHFVAFEEGELRWMSCAEGADRARLVQDYSVIKQLVQETFGVGTKIVALPCDKTPEPEPEPRESQSAPEEEGPSSCMQASLGVSATPEYDPQEILEQPMVQKAIEIFQPEKVKIVSRV
ncbi:MAG: DNA polymerase III subunit gamma/tau [Campylobacterales bacterium]